MCNFPRFVRCWLVLTLVLLGTTPTWAQSTVAWKSDLDQAKKEAQKSGKLVMLHFGADWCKPCQQVEAYVFSAPQVFRAINEAVIPVKLDVDLHPQLVSQYGVDGIGIPADVFITPDGKMVKRIKTPLDAENYTRMLKDLGDLTKFVNNNQDLAKDLEDVRQKFENRPESSTTWERPQLQAPVSPSQQLAATSDFQPRGTVIKNPAAQSAPSTNPMAAPSGLKAAPETTAVPALSSTAPLKMSPSLSLDTKLPNATSQEFQPRSNGQMPPSSLSPLQPSLPNSPAANPMMPLANPNTPPAQLSSPSNKITPVTNAELSAAKSPADLGIPQVSKSEARIKPLHLEMPEAFALNGDCPVTLLKEGRWAAGDKRWGCVHRGKTYLFASEAYQKLFLSSPDDYSPILAGFDPVAFHDEGQLVDGDRRFGVFMTKNNKQAIVLFRNEASQKKFKESPQTYLDTIRTATQQADERKLNR